MHIIKQGLGYSPQFQPLNVISLGGRALRLIMGSQVDTLCNHQNL